MDVISYGKNAVGEIIIQLFLELLGRVLVSEIAYPDPEIRRLVGEIRLVFRKKLHQSSPGGRRLAAVYGADHLYPVAREMSECQRVEVYLLLDQYVHAGILENLR